MAETAEPSPAAPAPRRKRVDAGMILTTTLMLGSGVGVWLTKGSDRVVEIMTQGGGLMLSIAPKVLAAVLLAAWLRRLISREAIARWFGRASGFAGLLRAAGAGAILPGGPMTAYPIVSAFGAGGADAGAAAAFIASWQLLGANRIIVWEMAFIDHQAVAWRVLLCLPFPILLGLLARAAGRPGLRPRQGAR